jgi:EAL domain-containing protein (putative c-di-GMP-specific phosphodiesterase class I)
MYQAKNGGKGRLAVFTAAMTDIALNRLNTEADLRQALKNNEFRLHYQSVMSLYSQQVCGMEALVRWERDGRLIPPAQFIPIAEETGLIVPLGQWVLKEACQQAKYWQEQCPTEMPLTVSVNLSPRQFAHPNLVEDARQALAESSLDPRYLKLEITESTIMKDVEAAVVTLQKLKALGVPLSIDDFGTGYSSLSYLKQFPVDKLKIDRSFIDGLGLNRSDTAIVRMVIDLGNNLNLGVTAEGVETEQHVDLLRTMGCAHGQGYYFSRPVPSEMLVTLLKDKEGCSEHLEEHRLRLSSLSTPLQKN